MIVINQLPASNVELLEGKQNVPVYLDWFRIGQSRLAVTAEDGTEFGLAIPGGIEEGQVIAITETAYYYIVLREIDLISIYIATKEEAARAGFELGNRHMSLKITDSKIQVPYDQPLYEYLQKLGFHIRVEKGDFNDYIRCRAHGATDGGHSHGHSHEAHEHCHEAHAHSHDPHDSRQCLDSYMQPGETASAACPQN